MDEYYNEVVDFDTENIVGDLNLLLLNIPDDISLLEKVRWLYIKTGQLFSYDYRIANDINVSKKDIDFFNNYVSRYQTCIQISYIFNLMLNFIDPSLKANIINRSLGPNIGNGHCANEIIMPTGEKYILDLTLDLYLIQSGCQTKQFGFTTNSLGEYDIISLNECFEMDQKLGLVKDMEYVDDKILRVKKSLDKKDYSDMKPEEVIDNKLNVISNFVHSFKGYYEGRQYVNKLFMDLLKMKYKEFNLIYNNDDSEQLITCFHIEYKGAERWIIYNNKLGLIKTTKDKVENMLNNGWSTHSSKINELFEIGKRK